ncbi:tetratricopeptide repeat protein [Akkermansiaceae bacterium]|nr:tetratricopeptide repeat protein [Akkermansiaceae bacterium]
MAEPKIEFYNAAIDAVQSGQLPEALKAIEASLTEDPNDVQSWQLYAVILNALGETGKAENAMAKVKELGLSEADELVMKAADAIGQGKTDLAITHYEDALELEPDRAEVYVSYALVLIQGGYPKDAALASAKAVEMAPHDASAWYARGRILRLVNKKEEALEAYDKALGLEPGLILASYERGMVLAESGRLQEALNCFEKVLQNHPEDAAAAEAKANILKAMEEQG